MIEMIYFRFVILVRKNAALNSKDCKKNVSVPYVSLSSTFLCRKYVTYYNKNTNQFDE